MRAVATFSIDGLGRAELGPGDLIGRMSTAALFLDDPRVSEAHAMVSLRHGELYLLALRRMVACRGRPVSEVLLEPGLEIELAHRLVMSVEEVTRPERVPALEAEGMGTRSLGPVASILLGPPLRVTARFVPGASAHLWSTGDEGWRLRVADRPVRVVRHGDQFIVGDVRFRLTAMMLGSAGQVSTQGAGGIGEPLHLIAHYETVEFHRPGRPAVTVAGVGARLISELVALNGPVPWEVVARELWSDDVEPGELRRRWDVTLCRLRNRLRDEGLRGDLLRSGGGGQVQLVLYEGDRVDDRS